MEAGFYMQGLDVWVAEESDDRYMHLISTRTLCLGYMHARLPFTR